MKTKIWAAAVLIFSLGTSAALVISAWKSGSIPEPLWTFLGTLIGGGTAAAGAFAAMKAKG